MAVAIAHFDWQNDVIDLWKVGGHLLWALGPVAVFLRVSTADPLAVDLVYEALVFDARSGTPLELDYVVPSRQRQASPKILMLLLSGRRQVNRGDRAAFVDWPKT